MIEVCMEASIDGSEQRVARVVMDGLAEALTVNRTLWHIKPHG
jgi:hypothetical protein